MTTPLSGKQQHPVALVTRLLPILFFEAWLTFTLLGFFFGTRTWGNDNLWQIALYALTGQLMLFLGYMSAINTAPKVLRSHKCLPPIAKQIEWFVLVCSIVTIIYYSISIYKLGYAPDRFFFNLLNPGTAYNMYQKLPRVPATGWYARGQIFVSFFIIMSLPVICVFWSRLSPGIKVLALLTIFLRLAYFMSIGTNKVIFETIVTISVFSWIGLYGGRRLKGKEIAWYGAFVSAMCFLFCIYFCYGIHQRTGGWKESSSYSAGTTVLSTEEHVRRISRQLNETNNYGNRGASVPAQSVPIQTVTSEDKPPSVVFTINRQHPIIKYTPKWFSQGVLSIEFYVCQGYSALGYSLTCPWKWTYGFGHSLSMLVAVERKFPELQVLNRSFPGQIEKKYGYPIMTHWHSIYPWLASDLSFAGVLVFILFLGRYLCMTWIDSISRANIVSPTLCFLFCIACFFIPCNNQIMQSTNYEFAFILLFLIWFFMAKEIRPLPAC